MQAKNAQSGEEKRGAGSCPAWVGAAAALTGTLLARGHRRRDRALAAGLGWLAWRLLCPRRSNVPATEAPGGAPAKRSAIPTSAIGPTGVAPADQGFQAPLKPMPLHGPALAGAIEAQTAPEERLPSLLDLDPVPSLVPLLEGHEPPLGDQILGKGPGFTHEELDWVPPVLADLPWQAAGSTIPDTVELPEIPESQADGVDASPSRAPG